MKKQNGISLVALVITIIVMVILAGVIITAAVADGGIIYRAQVAMKEEEMGDIVDIIKTSYVYKTTASTNNHAYLDLGKTGIAIYENLTANGFTVDGFTAEDKNGDPILDENGQPQKTVEVTKDENGEEIGITVEVEGKHGNYTAELDKTGDVKIEDDDAKDDSSDTITPGDTTFPEYSIEDLELLRKVLPEKEIALTDAGKTLTFKNEEENKEATVTIGTVFFINQDFETNIPKYLLSKIKYKENNYVLKLMQISETAGKITNVEAPTNFNYYGKRYEEENNEDGSFYVDSNGTYELVDVDYQNTIYNSIYFGDCVTGEALIYENIVYCEAQKMSGISIGWQFANISEDGNEINTIDVGCGSTKYILTQSNLPIEFDYLCYSENGKHGPASSTAYAKTDAIFITENSKGIDVVIEDEGLVIPSYIFQKPYTHYYMSKFGYLRSIVGKGSQGQISTFGKLDTIDKLEITKDYGVFKKGTIFKKLTLEFNSQNKTKYKIYDTNETISSTITIEKDKPVNTAQDPGYLEIQMSGTISYLPEYSDGIGLILIKRDGMYFAVESTTDIVLDEANNKFTVKEYNSSMIQTGKTIEYTVEGKNLTNKQVN